jgi:hypothetical protein
VQKDDTLALVIELGPKETLFSIKGLLFGYLFGEFLVSCTSRGQVETKVPRLVIDKQIVLNTFALYFKPKLFITLATFRRTVSKLSLVSTCGMWGPSERKQ